MSDGNHVNGDDTVKNGTGKSLTITQLRRELTSYGIPLPPSHSKKEVYLQLYDSQVLPRIRGGEFSSDDEIYNDGDGDRDDDRRSVSPSDSLLAAHSDIIDTVEKMQDNELYLELKRLGQNIGPVVDSTRSMYKKLLKSIMVRDLKLRHRGDTTTESESEDELNSSVTHLIGNSASASTSGSGSSPPGGSTSSAANTSTSHGNGFSSGESDIDNVVTSEDYAAKLTPTKGTRKTTPRKTSPTKRASSTPRKEDQRFPTPGRSASAATKNLVFELDSSFPSTSTGQRSTQEFGSRYRARHSVSTTTRTERPIPRVTLIANPVQDWGASADYGVGYASGEPEISKSRRAKVIDGRSESNSNWTVLAGVFFAILGILILLYYYRSFGNDISKDDAIDQQIEDTLKLLSKSNDGALD